jgi:hypothetical protein
MNEEETKKGSTDDGYFGSGIYFTNGARYASDIYSLNSQGVLVLAWVSMYRPFPVVGDEQQLDMAFLKGKAAYKNYNAHYVPVRSIFQSNLLGIYHPCKPGEIPSCDEIVVFQKSQAVPRFWVELELGALYTKAPSTKAPRFIQELIPHLKRLLQKSDIDEDLKLRNILYQQLTVLLTKPGDDDLE